MNQENFKLIVLKENRDIVGEIIVRDNKVFENKNNSPYLQIEYQTGDSILEFLKIRLMIKSKSFEIKEFEDIVKNLNSSDLPLVDIYNFKIVSIED